jgi:hypothetical protein
MGEKGRLTVPHSAHGYFVSFSGLILIKGRYFPSGGLGSIPGTTRKKK